MLAAQETLLVRMPADTNSFVNSRKFVPACSLDNDAGPNFTKLLARFGSCYVVATSASISSWGYTALNLELRMYGAKKFELSALFVVAP